MSLAAECYVLQQLVSNFVCQLFGALQLAYSELIRAFSWNQLADVLGSVADESCESESKHIPKQ